ncbi:MAG: GNAT family N-acetyltransferase [Syntrophorhabdaceae bacterium]|nr:GNAT family N-acetyltransferase [Syntrophorhabdaceae bacterium]
MAYIPEHIVGLMASISGGEPFLINDCLCYSKSGLLIVIGYPLNGVFSKDLFIALLNEATSLFNPLSVRVAAPEIPDEIFMSSKEKGIDTFYNLNIEGFSVKRRLMREVEKARERLNVEVSREFTEAHEKVMEEFLKTKGPNARIKDLYLSLPRWIKDIDTTSLLTARDKKGRVSAFYAVDFWPKRFAAYILGCHSERDYTPHASDLLFYEMVRIAREKGKRYINLGLGVNEGIKRFKEKWGGVPSLGYTFCEYETGEKRGGFIDSFMKFIRILPGGL